MVGGKQCHLITSVADTIRAIHHELAVNGFSVAATETAAANFGSDTEARLCEFQSRHRLTRTGTLDQVTGGVLALSALVTTESDRAKLRAELKDAVDKVPDSPEYNYWLARYAIIAGDYALSKRVSPRVRDLSGLNVDIGNAVLNPGTGPGSPRQPEVPFPESFYSYRYNLMSQQDIDELRTKKQFSGTMPSMARARHPNGDPGEQPPPPPPPPGVPDPPPTTAPGVKPEQQNRQKNKAKSSIGSSDSPAKSTRVVSDQKVTKAINDSYSEVHNLTHLSIKPPWTYKIEIRRFAKPTIFGGGFKGDSPDFIANPDVTSKTRLEMTFGMDPTGDFSYSATASKSRAIGDFAKWISFVTSGPFEPEYVKTAAVSSEAKLKVLGEGVIAVSGHSAGANPLVSGSPDMDTYVRVIAAVNNKDKPSERILFITGELRGNPFLWAEIVIEDHFENRLLLGTFDASSRSPYADLFGSDIANHVLDFGMDIPVGPSCEFVSFPCIGAGCDAAV
jgi:hypothetical protein